MHVLHNVSATLPPVTRAGFQSRGFEHSANKHNKKSFIASKKSVQKDLVGWKLCLTAAMPPFQGSSTHPQHTNVPEHTLHLAAPLPSLPPSPLPYPCWPYSLHSSIELLPPPQEAYLQFYRQSTGLSSSTQLGEGLQTPEKKTPCRVQHSHLDPWLWSCAILLQHCLQLLTDHGVSIKFWFVSCFYGPRNIFKWFHGEAFLTWLFYWLSVDLMTFGNPECITREIQVALL